MPWLALALALAADAPALPIGRLQFGRHLGTAFLVGNCSIMTAKHVLPRRRVRLGTEGRFRIAGRSIRARVSGIGDAANPWGVGDARDGDWAVLRLDRCVEREFGHFQLLDGPIAASPLFHASTSFAGFPGGGRRMRRVDGCATAWIGAEGTIVLRCAARHGHSGAPVFVQDAAGGLVAVGVVSALTPDAPWTLASPLPATGVVDDAGSTLPSRPAPSGKEQQAKSNKSSTGAIPATAAR